MKLFYAFQVSLLVGACGALALSSPAFVQDKAAASPAQSTPAAPAAANQAAPAASSSSSSASETVAKPLTKKQLAKKQKALEKELAGPWKKWMSEDVLYIITDEEKQGFQAAEDGRRTAGVRRAVLATPGSDTGHGRERVQRRAL